MISSFIVTVLAQVPALEPTGDMLGWLLESAKWMFEQYQAKNFMPAVGMLVMVLVFLFNNFFKTKLSKNALPWVSAVIGMLMAGAANLVGLAAGYTTQDWVSTLTSGLMAGAAASGLWSMLGKYVMTKLVPSAPATPEAPKTE